MPYKVLVVDDEEAIRKVLQVALEQHGYLVESAQDFDEAMDRLREGAVDLVFSDILLGGKTGIDLLQEINAMELTCPVVLITGAPSVNTASEAVRLGAFDYISKPFGIDRILRVASAALRHKELNDKLAASRKTLNAILRSVTDAIITVDADMNLLQANETAHRLCGLGPEHIGRPFNHMALGCSGSCLESLRRTLKERIPVSAQHIECIHNDKPRRVINLNTYPLRYETGEVTGAVLVMRDETRLSELERDLNERKQFHHIVGQSRQMQEVYSLIERVADIESTILLLGESGTGKELVADALHYSGRRSAGPLVKVNCSALSENLLESELFGHVKGAFTGALHDKTGKFELASGGTIFLDEIGDISPLVQVKLLRVLQSFEVERVGDTKTQRVDVRVVAATNRDLVKRVKMGEFREDLYYRLKVVEIHIPPLRERKDDIPLMVDYFIEKLNRKLGKNISSVSNDVMRLFLEYSWPGNVRELENAIEYACVLASGDVITRDNLPRDFMTPLTVDRQRRPPSKTAERDEIIRALEACDWKKAPAARMLGVSRMTIYRKMHEYNISDR